jgi:hypothetical protein
MFQFSFNWIGTKPRTVQPSKGTCITMLVQDHDVTIINTQTGQIIRELTIDPTRDYQPIDPKKKT